MTDIPRAVSVYEGFFTGGARIIHTDVVLGMHELGGQQEVLAIFDEMARETEVQSMAANPSYLALQAAGLSVATLGRKSDARVDTPYSDKELDLLNHHMDNTDVVLSLKEQPLYLLNQAGRHDKPVIVTLHRSDPELDSPIVDQLKRAISTGMVAACIACADSTKTAYAKVGVNESLIKVVTNGVDLDRFRPSAENRHDIRESLRVPAEAPMILLAARYAPEKNIPLFLQSACRFLDEVPDGQIIMAGTGMSLANEQLAKDIETAFAGRGGLTERLHPLGMRRDIERLYAATDVVACTSSHEAYPCCLLEGMASGAVPVATDVGDNQEIIGEQGIITAADPIEIAKAWVEAIAHKDELRTKILRDRQRLDRSRMIADYVAAINSVV